ncbi:hypothetical protein B0H10DRAFT_2219571 [Mycena sp. CBHHK59/15]|nr:hypothetical protein B0H10DRAFT_2219571 [Mycena sp. CBHHK59/15]
MPSSATEPDIVEMFDPASDDEEQEGLGLWDRMLGDEPEDEEEEDEGEDDDHIPQNFGKRMTDREAVRQPLVDSTITACAYRPGLGPEPDPSPTRPANRVGLRIFPLSNAVLPRRLKYRIFLPTALLALVHAAVLPVVLLRNANAHQRLSLPMLPAHTICAVYAYLSVLVLHADTDGAFFTTQSSRNPFAADQQRRPPPPPRRASASVPPSPPPRPASADVPPSPLQSNAPPFDSTSRLPSQSAFHPSPSMRYPASADVRTPSLAAAADKLRIYSIPTLFTRGVSPSSPSGTAYPHAIYPRDLRWLPSIAQ